MNKNGFAERISAFMRKKAVRGVLSVLLVAAVFLSSTGAAASASRLVKLSPSYSGPDEATQLSPVRRTAFVSNDTLIRIKAISLELDIDISILDMTGGLVTGVPFEIVVSDSATGEEVARVVDEDMDGNEYIDDVKEGEYIVSVEPMEDFETPNPVSVDVVPKIVFEKQDVSELIVSADEIDASQDDKQYGSSGGGGGAGNVSGGTDTVADTVEYVPSSTAEVDKKDANGNPVVGYRLRDGAAIEAADGKNYIKLGDGTRTKYYVDLDSAGNITRIYYDYQVEVTAADGTAFSGDMIVTFLTAEGAEGGGGETNTPDPGTEGGNEGGGPNTPGTGNEGGNEGGGPNTPGTGNEGGNEGVDPPPSEPVYETRVETIEVSSLFNADGSRNGSCPEIPIERFTEKVTVRYGWQDNYTRYYDKNGVMVTGVQVISGKTYIFGSDGLLGGSGSGTRLGIDVSTYQNTIDWNRVKAAGIEFVFIRLGFRGYGTGKLVADSMFRKNISGAMAAGLKVGVYFYSQAINEQEAVEEASMCLQLLEGYGGLQFPVAIDVEYATSSLTGRADRLTRDERTRVCIAFCETVKNAGYIPAVYANKDFLENKLYASSISNYIIWLAHYTGSVDVKSSYKGRYDIWQYTSRGTVDGISGPVDMNISYW